MCLNTDTRTCFFEIGFKLLFFSSHSVKYAYEITGGGGVPYGNTTGTESKVKISTRLGFEPIVVADF